MKMLIARENTGHASNLLVDGQYSIAHFNSSSHLDSTPAPATFRPQAKTVSHVY